MSVDRAVEAVLWDADGVLQHLPAGWEASMRPAVGHLVDDVEGFLAAAFAAERPCLTGHARWVEVLPRLLEEWGIPEAFDDALRVWLTIEPVEPARALAAKVRGRGVRCYLVTNQDEHRARFMQRELGYDDLLDGAFYSCELRAAKPDPAFFRAVLDRLGLAPETVLFVDDNAASVDSARELGLRAERWHVDHGVEALRDHLSRHGLDV
ncbi:MAG TPA: HAD-IA family hydrolase [Nocardioides sp.]|nr:HAD-IA family hydrolase [uncultured Nocardioides sp.]HEX5986306.1 HAD-IA family hydrolase [Nocardioides sp.]